MIDQERFRSGAILDTAEERYYYPVEPGTSNARSYLSMVTRMLAPEGDCFSWTVTVVSLPVPPVREGVTDDADSCW